jgi:isochorismate pyruvate lyase
MKTIAECNNIEDIREAIDMIDRQIIGLLSNRFDYVREIVKYKKPDKDSIIAIDRYNKVLKRRRELAEEHGLDPDVIEDMYKRLIKYFIDEELKIINNEDHKK